MISMFNNIVFSHPSSALGLQEQPKNRCAWHHLIVLEQQTLEGCQIARRCLVLDRPVGLCRFRVHLHAIVLHQQQFAQQQLEVATAQTKVLQLLRVRRRHGLDASHRLKDHLGGQQGILGVQTIVVGAIEETNGGSRFLLMRYESEIRTWASWKL